MKLTLSGLAVASFFVFNINSAHGKTIGGNDIMPSTDLQELQIPLNQVGSTLFPIEEIADNVTSDAFPFNGFASPSSSGTITLDLDGDFDLDSFLLWNDINVQSEGIRDFRLDFFDNANSMIDVGFSTTFTAPLGQVEAEEYSFESTVGDVSRVDLVVLNSQPFTFNRIEIREVAFTGSAKSVPEAGTILGAMTAICFGTIIKKRSC